MNSHLKITILTLFPEMFPGPLASSIHGKALADKIFSLETVNIRNFSKDKHETVDDSPYGGGSGMVMKPDVLADTIESVMNVQCSVFSNRTQKIIYMSPRGSLLTQRKARELAGYEHLIILCGRYEGVDQRVLDEYNIEEISIGDYILSGGELAAMVLIDACIRHIPGVLGNQEAHSEESFGAGPYANLLEYPHYTRPAEWRGYKVPEVLLSGNHGEINRWRLAQAEEITRERRPDLWEKYRKRVL